MAQRVKGQDVSVIVVQDGQILASLHDVRNFEVTLKITKKQEGYVGEKTDRYDEIFNGADFRLSIHTEDEGVFPIIQAIIDRARNRTPGVVFNVQATLNYPNGDRPIVVLPDVHFGDVPVNVPGRGDYVELTYEGSCSTPNFL